MWLLCYASNNVTTFLLVQQYWCLQDTVKGGKRGTRQQCLALARQILQQGRCAIIDRCNVEPEQRRDFLQLAQELSLPVSPQPWPCLSSLRNLDS